MTERGAAPPGVVVLKGAGIFRGSGLSAFREPDGIWRRVPREEVLALFVSVGASGGVYPAAGFVAEARGRARSVALKLEPSGGGALFDEARHGPATRLVPAFVDAPLRDAGA